MGRFWLPWVLVFNTLGVAFGSILPGLALAPEVAETVTLAQLRQVDSLQGAKRIQSRVQAELENLSPARFTRDMGELAPYFTLAQVVYRVNQRITLEESADADYRRALELATQAIAARNAAAENADESLETFAHQEFLWRAAIAQLDQIPEESLLSRKAIAKKTEYEKILAPVAARVDELESGFLQEIAENTGRPEAIRITICHLSGECRNYQGDIPPESPASLIKLPIAVALMDKVTREGIDLDTEVYVEPYNWTENANGAQIYVDREYSLREIMARMIKESNNIATNQLVDYIGWDEMNQTLGDRGFEQTRVNTKLAGDSTLPSVNTNSGGGPNVMTTNEVTEMMRQIYTFQHPGDDEILDALVGQYDWEFGYTAIKQLRDKRVAWIGEKTGQNSRVIGSSVAVKIDNERYVMTVTIDDSANQVMLRQVIGEVIQHILDDGHLVNVTGR
ncbi:MAG: serine hydrolase [Leptolyngbyaceae cyanobacterium T60_A2020_046]|nr:serine hydrolase [Leptolyngbyaceae cyanobacterium T60_A2020_046]